MELNSISTLLWLCRTLLGRKVVGLSKKIRNLSRFVQKELQDVTQWKIRHVKKSFSVLKEDCERAAFCFEEKFADAEDARFSNDVKFRKDSWQSHFTESKLLKVHLLLVCLCKVSYCQSCHQKWKFIRDYYCTNTVDTWKQK